MRYFINAGDLITRANTHINSIGNRVGQDTWLDYITSSIKTLRASRILPWMKKSYSFPVFNDVFKYPLVDDFDALIDSNPPLITTGSVGKQLTYSTEREFRRMIQIGLAIGWENGEKFLLCRGQSALNDVQLEEFDDVETEYTASGDASNLVSDETNYRSGSASLKFDITDSTSAFLIERDLASGIDVSDIFNLATAFVNFYMPTVITSIRLRFGKDSSNYYETPLITKQYADIDFVADWNELGVSLNGATLTGTVDLEDILYIAIVGDCTGVTDKNFRVDGFYLKAGNNQEIAFNSYNIIKNSSGVWKAVVSSVDDEILWDQDYDDLLLFRILDKAGFFSFRDNIMVQKSLGDYSELNRLFESRYPSQEALQKAIYYRRNKRF